MCKQLKLLHNNPILPTSAQPQDDMHRQPVRSARNVAKAKAGGRRSQLEEVRDAAGAGPDAAQLQVGPGNGMVLCTPLAHVSNVCYICGCHTISGGKI